VVSERRRNAVSEVEREGFLLFLGCLVLEPNEGAQVGGFELQDAPELSALVQEVSASQVRVSSHSLGSGAISTMLGDGCLQELVLSPLEGEVLLLVVLLDSLALVIPYWSLLYRLRHTNGISDRSKLWCLPWLHFSGFADLWCASKDQIILLVEL
jgi:hypothetical protein